MNKRRIEFLDFAKGFAILSIAIFHYSQPYTTGLWSKAIMIGGTGVHLFFILSGFGLGLSSTKLSFTTFYLKRFSKILIPYYFAIALICIINEGYQLYDKNTLYAIGGHFFLYKMFDEKIIGSYGYHFWFISTIVQFYIFFPLIIRIKNSLSLKHFLILSFSVSFIYWILISGLGFSHLRVCNSFFLQYLWEFNLGIVLAEQYKNNGRCFWDKNINILAPIAVLGLSTMAVMALGGGRAGQTFNDLPASIGYTCLVATVYILTAKLLPIRLFFTSLGKISYELYLLHMLSFILLNRFFLYLTGLSPNLLISLFIILPVSIMISKYFAMILSLLNEYVKTQHKKKIARRNV